MGFGRVWGALLAIFSICFSIFSVFLAISCKKIIFDALGRGLGRVLGGAGERFGRVWEPLGRCWGLPGLLFAVFRVSGSLLDAVGRSQGCCMLFFVFFCIFYIFCVVVALSDASAASVARPQDCCLLFFVICCCFWSFLIVL